MKNQYLIKSFFGELYLEDITDKGYTILKKYLKNLN